MAIINRKVRQFSDLDLNFLPHPSTGDIVRSFDEDSINKNLRYLILTKNYERPFHPEKGCQVNNLLFENADFMTTQMIKRTIENAIQNFEPRVLLISVDATDNTNNEIRIDITYKIINTLQPVTFTTTLKRTR